MAQRNCPECKAELQPIKLLDATHRISGDEGLAHVPFSYAVPEAKRSLFMRAYPAEGSIDAMMCPECGRTLLYARAN